ncbi:MAG: LLM class flavin-dependent oxidoreductase [Acidimicrobiales bacterium]|jgi:alkanesulfonate monooxygenase SsuD/methylene tetrahydromethanopterin reductase-like flavin-dependent oxidoreductase (luciferase family)
MRYGLFLPAMAEFADPHRVADLAGKAEDTGWDGFFLWDHIVAGPERPVADTWVTLTAAAGATRTIRLGSMVTPLARRRPWVLARQLATLDHFCRGRLVAGIGLGDDGWQEFSSFAETVDPVERGELLDESLEVLQQCLSGEPVEYHGERLDVTSVAFLPRPVQDPIPIWAACRWPHRRPLARAARLQGIFPIFPFDGAPAAPDPREVATIRGALDQLGVPGPESYDLVLRYAVSLAPPGTTAATATALEVAGATWILEGFGPGEPPANVVEEIVAAGPPGS